MNKQTVTEAMRVVRDTMAEHAEELIRLDAKFGDGDLGISMKQGFEGVYKHLEETAEEDLGQVFRGCSASLNEAAPSTLGTILSFGLMGMAKSLKGKKEATLMETAVAMEAGVHLIMEKAKSKPGEKTILDSLFPAVEALKAHGDQEPETAYRAAREAAEQGREKTKTMAGQHGRIAYYGEKSIGEPDGGATVGMLIFQALHRYMTNK